MKETTLPQHDSTANVNDLITDNGIAGRGTASGQIGLGDSFNGGVNQDIFTSPANSNLSGPDLSVSAWFDLAQLPSVGGNNETIVYHTLTASPWMRWIIEANTPTNQICFGWKNTTPTAYEVCGATTLVTGTWYHVTGTYDSTNHLLNVFLNGNRDNAAPLATTGTMVVGTSSGVTFSNNTIATFNFNGTIDEGRVSKSIRSAGWIKTEYNDQNSPSTFLTFGGAVAGAVSGTQTFTVSINPGVLTVVAPANVTSPNLSPGTTAAAVNLGALSYTDTLNDATSWSVTLAATDLGAGTIPFTRFTIGVCTSANIVSGPGAVGVPTAGAASQTLAGTDGVPGTTFSTAITLATAASAVEGSYSTPAGATGNTITIVVPGTATGAGITSTLQYTITG